MCSRSAFIVERQLMITADAERVFLTGDRSFSEADVDAWSSVHLLGPPTIAVLPSLRRAQHKRERCLFFNKISLKQSFSPAI